MLIIVLRLKPIVKQVSSFAMQDALRGNLERPLCMQTNTKFVAPAEQCPPKPRGRKPKKTEGKDPKHDGGRPSAAAAGFNTEGLSDKEVKDLVAKYYGESNGQEQKDNIEEVVSTKKRSRYSKSVEAEVEKKDKVEKTTVEAVPTKKRPRGSQHVEEKKVDKKGKVEKTTVEAVPTKKRPRGSKHVEDEKEGDETSKGKRTKKPVAAAENDENEADASSKRKKRSTGAKEETTTTVKRRKGKESQKTEEEIKAEKKIATKARVSRKSAAYHKAVKESKARGESKEDQVKAGKAATCRIFWSQSTYVSVAHYSVLVSGLRVTSSKAYKACEWSVLSLVHLHFLSTIWVDDLCDAIGVFCWALYLA